MRAQRRPSPEIAKAAGLEERYVREWLGNMVVSRIVDYDPSAPIYVGGIWEALKPGGIYFMLDEAGLQNVTTKKFEPDIEHVYYTAAKV